MKEYKVEPLDLMQHINTKYREPFIRDAIFFDREINVETLKRAVNKLTKDFPLLKCRYDAVNNIYIDDEIDNVNRFVKTVSRDEYDALILESLNDSFFRVSVIDSRILVVVVSHMVTDGSGFKKLLYGLASAYSDDINGGVPNAMHRDFGILSRTVKNPNKATVKMLLSMIGKYKNPFILKQNGVEPTYIIKSLNSEIMSAAHEKARTLKATLNDLFMATYASAICKRLGIKRISLPCTVDLRKYNPQEAGIGNLTGSYNINIDVNPYDLSKTLAVVARNTKAQKLTNNDIAGPMLLVKKYQSSTLNQFLKPYEGMSTSNAVEYTNLGVIDKEKLKFGDALPTRVIGFSCLNKSPYFQLAVSSFDGETTLSTLAACTADEREYIDELMTDMSAMIVRFSE